MPGLSTPTHGDNDAKAEGEQQTHHSQPHSGSNMQKMAFGCLGTHRQLNMLKFSVMRMARTMQYYEEWMK